MNRTDEIPKPSDSGADGTQLESKYLPDLVEANELNNLAHTIKGIAASNARAFGSEVTSALIAGATSQLASELHYSRTEASKLHKKIDDLNETLKLSMIENAVLNERISASHQTRYLRNIAITVGTTLMTTSIPLFDSTKYHFYGFVSLIIGAILVIIGWYSPAKGGGK